MAYIDILFLIGRVLFGGYFVMMGLNHFTKRTMLASYAQSKGVPSPGFAVLGTGILLLLGGLGILLGVYIQWAVLLLTIFLILVSLKMHAFWSVADPNLKMMDMTNFLKNMALLGAGIMMLAIETPWVFGLM